VKTTAAVSRTKTLLILLSFSALSYLLDCEIATLLKGYPDTLPFLQRGAYTGPCFALTLMLLVAAFLAPLFSKRERI
jgi:hypothetical protein